VLGFTLVVPLLRRVSYRFNPKPLGNGMHISINIINGNSLYSKYLAKAAKKVHSVSAKKQPVSHEE